jgi:acetyl-CoA C-acetyltransferase
VNLWRKNGRSQEKNKINWQYESHTKAHANAYEEGFYDDLIVECAGLKKDTILRPETTLERLGKLRPAFERSEKGTLTAGNSTAMTDGAACFSVL